MNVEDYIKHACSQHQKMLAVLLDPEELIESESICQIGSHIREHRPDFVFVGGSTFFESPDALISQLRNYTGDIPIVIFPGHPAQFTPAADALLFLSLISGNNPDMLIGQQAASARKIKESGIETISMGYILVDGGRESATARITGTRPIPASDSERIADTALAGEMLGLHLIYLEAGSGALHPAGGNLIRIVRSSIRVPLIVGGGMHSAAEAEAAWGAGADIVVIGNHLEESPADLALFVEARNKMNTHQMQSAVM